MNLDIVVLVGSLRKDSVTRKLVKAMTKVAPAGMSFEFLDIGSLPHFNQDDEANPTSAVTAFKERIQRADAVLFATPEYNRSVPGVLKNAIDVGSRPYGKSAWSGKPAAVLSVTPGALGAFGSNHHLRQSLVFLNMPTLAQPEAYIANAAGLMDEAGDLKAGAGRDFLVSFLTAFETWVGKFSTKADSPTLRRVS